MKTIYSFIAIVVLLSFTACTSELDNDGTENASSLEAVMNVYGAEYASLNTANTNQIPSVLTEDMRGVLEALRQRSNALYDCKSVSEKGFDKVVMTGNYKAVTRSGDAAEGFALSVELKFSVDKGQVYYWGTDYSYSSTLFDWQAQGLSLAPVKDGDGYTYAFESESFLYFKVGDNANTVVKVPIIFKGNYNFRAETGTYSFQLLKYSK